jgi:tetratricopeptide (TPR) repeat protein
MTQPKSPVLVCGRIAIWCACAFLLLLLVFPSDALAQATPRELRQAANEKLRVGDFMGAIPDLQQLIEYLGNSDDKRVQQSMETIFYNLGICYFFVGQFAEAEEAFRVYMKKYPRTTRVRRALLYVADSIRFRNELEKAIKAYEECIRKYLDKYTLDLRADIYSSIARCYLADGRWKDAIEPLHQTYLVAPDFIRRNWAATLMTTAFFKELDLDKVYPLTPFILRRNSFASRSIAFNMAALEAGDELFADERYRDALWVHRMVYPHDMVLLRSEEYLEYLHKQADIIRQTPGDPRRLMRIQESIGELEEEIEAIQGIENYDLELHSRVARGYMEMMRYWEAREIFLYLHQIADPTMAEESLFYAFRCSTQLLPWDRAYQIGGDYMTKYPGGEYYDPISLAIGQMYAKQENWPKVISHLKKALEVSPDHESAAACYFLIGYASFMEEIFDQAIEYFELLTTKFPANDLVPPSTYWIGMAYLFQGDYEKAAPPFDRVLEDFPDCMYIEDTSFRRAVCDYGMNQMEASKTRLDAFMSTYPKSKLISEATMMRADIAGALGELDDAIRFYKQAMDFEDLNIEYYNHCAFQAGRIMKDEERWQDMRAHYLRYIDRNREGSNLPLAIYWVGLCLWNTDEQAGALRFYREACEKYGADPRAIGIDMILDEWIGRTKRSTKGQAAAAWTELGAALTRALSEKNKVMELRLKRVLLFHPKLKAGERARVMNAISKESNLPYASPAVLQSMLDYAKETGNDDFALKVSNYIVSEFTETDYALSARMVLAQTWVSKGRNAGSRQQANEFYAEAIKHLDVIRTVFAQSGEAAESLMLLAEIYREQEKFKDADACYKQVLGVRDWKSYWPKALYGRGECAYEQRQFDPASAYYERIYVMYGHYKKWAAKAYLRRAECLRKIYQNEKALEVLEEMLRDPDISAMPEAKPARDLFERMGGRL